MKKLVYLNIVLGIFLVSCSSDSTNDLLEPVQEEDVISYISHIKPIIDNNCVSCHSNPPVNGAPIHLTTYDMVRNAVMNSNLISRISSQPGDPGFMPSGGPRLPEQSINLIIQWEAEGFLESE